MERPRAGKEGGRFLKQLPPPPVPETLAPQGKGTSPVTPSSPPPSVQGRLWLSPPRVERTFTPAPQPPSGLAGIPAEGTAFPSGPSGTRADPAALRTLPVLLSAPSANPEPAH